LPIADFQLPIYLRAQPAKKSAIGNWQSAMFLRVFNDYALNNIRHVLATIDRGFKLLVNLFPLQHG
jgi:hypothetical protein